MTATRLPLVTTTNPRSASELNKDSMLQNAFLEPIANSVYVTKRPGLQLGSEISTSELGIFHYDDQWYSIFGGTVTGFNLAQGNRWRRSIQYNIGDVVEHDNRIWAATAPSLGVTPVSGSPVWESPIEGQILFSFNLPELFVSSIGGISTSGPLQGVINFGVLAGTCYKTFQAPIGPSQRIDVDISGSFMANLSYPNPAFVPPANLGYYFLENVQSNLSVTIGSQPFLEGLWTHQPLPPSPVPTFAEGIAIYGGPPVELTLDHCRYFNKNTGLFVDFNTSDSLRFTVTLHETNIKTYVNETLVGTYPQSLLGWGTPNPLFNAVGAQYNIADYPPYQILQSEHIKFTRDL